MDSLKAKMDAARAGIEIFDTEAIKMLTALLPTGNVWKPKYRRPRGAAVYAIWEPGVKRPVYVGQTEELFRRIRQHSEQGRYDDRIHILTIHRTEADEDHLRDLEAVAIEALKPTSGKHHPFRRGTSHRLQTFIETLDL